MHIGLPKKYPNLFFICSIFGYFFL